MSADAVYTLTANEMFAAGFTGSRVDMAGYAATLRESGYNCGALLLETIAAKIPLPIMEPLGLAAVVLDADGDRWVRLETPGLPAWRIEYGTARLRWADIKVSRVLTEGLAA